MPSDSNAPRVVPTELCLGGRDLTGPVVSPDGSTVAVVSKAPGEPAELLLIPAFGGDERTLTFPDEPSGGRGMFGGCLAWSRDGRRLAVIARAGLWVVDLNGSSALLLPADGSSIAAPVWDTSGGVVVAVDAERVIGSRRTVGRCNPLSSASMTGDTISSPTRRCGEMAPTRGSSGRPGRCPICRGTDRRSSSPPAGPGRHRATPGGHAAAARSLADGSLACLRDDSGWLNLWRAGIPLALGASGRRAVGARRTLMGSRPAQLRRLAGRYADRVHPQ